MTQHKHITIVGAGLVGSLLAIYLAKRGYKVSVFERRIDMRSTGGERGRSINLALSNRGIKALRDVGLEETLRELAIPMNGRVMHNNTGALSFLPYGKKGQFINSISRSDLNIVLMNEAEKNGVTFYFDHRCLGVNFNSTSITFEHSGKHLVNSADLIIGADGAFSAVRTALQVNDRFNYSQDYIKHGYKEFHIPPGTGQSFQFEKNALHIWPRESFMLIALPNPDGSFTCTLFFPFEGKPSFTSLPTSEVAAEFFERTFPDAFKLIPDFTTQWNSVPPSSLVTIKCQPWVRRNVLLIGDAAHAIVPFYGQGMNAGFEDCTILNQLLDKHHDDWEPVMETFQLLRKPDTDAIAQLALDNFVEMRDLVADAEFLLRKKIEAKLHELYPDKWIPLYTMVTFREDIRYHDALRIGKKQKEIMDDVMRTPGIEEKWTSLNFEEIASRIHGS